MPAQRRHGRARRLLCGAMPVISYHVSQEQAPPSTLLRHAQAAEAAGFDAAFTSDHLQPWAPAQGHAAFAWAWLGAAMQATDRLTFSTITVPGGWRYSPVLVAQAIATLAAMFPGRMPWIALGSGEALNEAPVAGDWPAKPERDRRLVSGAGIIRALWAGQRVHADGPPPVQDTRLWCRPEAPPALFGAALTPGTAFRAGTWADGLLTTAGDLAALRANIDAFRAGGGEGKPVCVKVDLCWARTDGEALQQAHSNWRYNALAPAASADLRQPEDFDAATRHLEPQDMCSRVFASSRTQAHIEHLQRCLSLGVDHLDLHHVGDDQPHFIEVFGREVLPALRGSHSALR